ncbi:MAG TPA: thiol reductant ABC exporter subunit CydC [Chloroflexota bacterium]|nr:thiol reductant ABC exporter subunit CydC [Chloroflexota bacterium]
MNVLLRVLGFLRHHRLQVALAVLLGCATIAANVGLLATAAYLVAAAALKPLLIELAFPMYLVRMLGVSRAFLRYGERLVSHRTTLTLLAEVRAWFYGRVEPLSPARLLQYRSGDLLSRLARDVQELENVYLRAFAPVVVALVVALTTVAIFVPFSPALALAAALFLALAGVGVPLLVRALARRPGARQPALHAALTTQLVDGIQGMPDLLAFGQSGEQQRRLATLEGELGVLQRRLAAIGGLRAALSDLMANLAVWVILALAIPLVTGGAIGGVYLAFLALLMLGSFEAVQPLGQAFQSLGRSLAAGARLFEVADATPLVVDPAAPLPSPAGVPSLRFDRVGFSYDPEAAPALEEVSFSLTPGSRIAIAGASGSGKSTLARLALRAWDPGRGRICLDGHPLRRYALDDLRGQFAVVTQDTYIFAGTLRHNLLLARSGASDADLARVVEQARLTELVARLPDGLDSRIGEQGARISGGERQRIAIARALLKEAPILILDEATANLDPLTEHALLRTIHDHLEGRSLLLISHRLVLMERMDEILVLDHGRVVERGTQEQLLGVQGPYRQLYETQQALMLLS